ncbi:MAG: hypothetical protein QOH68_1161, partial [Nocardioidaceae bacterium]|nr:hypothetical protein [Nocardioidaceae bacterium]
DLFHAMEARYQLRQCPAAARVLGLANVSR